MMLNMLFCGDMWSDYAEKKLSLYFKKKQAVCEFVTPCGVTVCRYMDAERA